MTALGAGTRSAGGGTGSDAAPGWNAIGRLEVRQ
jgi:hypothetical protein